MDDKTVRAVALIAAALDRFPGDKSLYERAEEHFQVIKSGNFVDLKEIS